MMKLALLAFCAVLPGAIADAGDCTVADFGDVGFSCDCENPTLSDTCTTCLGDAGIDENSSEEEYVAAVHACAPAPARGACTADDILKFFNGDKDDVTSTCAVCNWAAAYAAVAADDALTDTEDEGAQLAALAACATTPASGQCTATDISDMDSASDSCVACVTVAAVAAGAADDTLTEEEAGMAGVMTCATAAAPGQCTAAEATAGKASIAAPPCDGDGTTAATPDDTSDDCPADPDVSDACEMCLFMSGEVSDMEAGTAEEWTAAIEVCEPTLEAKSSGTAGLVASLALASVSAVAAQL